MQFVVLLGNEREFVFKRRRKPATRRLLQEVGLSFPCRSFRVGLDGQDGWTWSPPPAQIRQVRAVWGPTLCHIDAAQGWPGEGGGGQRRVGGPEGRWRRAPAVLAQTKLSRFRLQRQHLLLSGPSCSHGSFPWSHEGDGRGRHH